MRAPVLRRPMDLVASRRQMLDELFAGLVRAAEAGNDHRKNRLALVAARLENLSPLGVLARGYSVTLDAVTRKVMRSVKQAHGGRKLITRVRDGEIVSVIES